MKCPKCGRSFERLLALSRTDNKTMICDECGTMEALDSLPHGVLSLQERTQKEGENMPSAGELLSKMLTKEKNGEDTTEIRKDFEYQSKRQLGGYCKDFSMGITTKESEETTE